MFLCYQIIARVTYCVDRLLYLRYEYYLIQQKPLFTKSILLFVTTYKYYQPFMSLNPQSMVPGTFCLSSLFGRFVPKPTFQMC